MVVWDAKDLIKYGINLTRTKDGKKVVTGVPREWQKLTKSVYNNEQNYAILTGSVNCILVVDLDNKGDFPGKTWFEDSFFQLENTNETLVTKTISGGYHVYFKYNEAVKNKNNYLDLQVDILVDRKCVYEGKGYDIVSDTTEIQELSQDQVRLLTQRKTEKGKGKDKKIKGTKDMVVYNGGLKEMEVKDKIVIKNVNKNLDTDHDRPFSAVVENNVIKCIHKGCSCIVKKGAIHSEEGHSMFYVNNDKSVVKTCFSHGSVVFDKNDPRARAIHREITFVIVDQNDITFCRLKDYMLDLAYEERLKRDKHGNVYKHMKSYAYVWYSEYKDFLNEIFGGNTEFERNPNNIENLVKFLKDYDNPKFAFIKPNKRYLGFNNGVLDTHTSEFIPEEECDPSIVVKKYLDVPFSGSTDTPLFDSIFDYQLNDNPEMEDIKKFVYFCLGRLFGIRDRYHFTLYLMGEAGCGKSLVIDVMKQFFRDVGAVSSTFEKTFGLSYLYKKDIIVCDDLPKDFSKVLPQAVFQSCITGGVLSIAFKGGEAKTVDWDVPLLFAGNYNPDYVDKGQISRRVVTLEFRNIVKRSDVDTGLFGRILETELDKIALKCIMAYKDALENPSFKDKNIWSICPEYFRENQEELKKDRNPLYKFLIEKCRYEVGCFIVSSEIRERFCGYIGKPIRQLDNGTFIQANENYIMKKVEICLYCNKVASSTGSSRCCEKSNSKDRRTTRVVMNISFITQ
jgi:phage/plasmid-associated DNA primase